MQSSEFKLAQGWVFITPDQRIQLPGSDHGVWESKDGTSNHLCLTRSLWKSAFLTGLILLDIHSIDSVQTERLLLFVFNLFPFVLMALYFVFKRQDKIPAPAVIEKKVKKTKQKNLNKTSVYYQLTNKQNPKKPRPNKQNPE